MEIDELNEFMARIRRRIDALGPWPERVPERQFQKLSQQCPRCLFWVPDELFVEHFAQCRYQCGLCGIRIESKSAFVRHCNDCAREHDQERRVPR